MTTNATIEIRRADDETETRALSRTQPVSIGRHSTCDVCIDEPGVGVLHCRLSWNRTGYEVTSGDPGGVDLNGSLVRHQLLKDGDLIRIGSVDIVLHWEPDGSQSGRSSRSGSRSSRHKATEEEPKDLPIVGSRDEDGGIGLAPISEEFRPSPQKPLPQPAIRSEEPTAEARESSRRLGSSSTTKKSAEKASSKGRAPDARDDDEDAGDKPSLVDEEIPVAEIVPSEEFEIPAPAASERSKAAAAVKPAQRSWLKDMRAPRRPGDRDPVRSPFVLGLGGGTAILALAGFVVWFLISRSAVQKEYDLAVDDLTQGRFAQASERFSQFLDGHPRHRYAEAARRGLGRANVEREISGASPSWSRGLTALQDFAEAHRDETDFADLQPEWARYAERIALGAAKTAEQTARAESLSIATDAERLFVRFAGTEKDAEARQRALAKARQSAEGAIARQKSFDASLAAMETALAAKTPMAAIEERQSLLDRYSSFQNNARLAALMQRSLDLEKDLVEREEATRAALTEDADAAMPSPITLTPHPRSRTDESSDGRALAVVAKGCLFAIDAVTGDPLWRRVVGFDAPFFPVGVTTREECWLLFDSRRNELQLVERRTGKVSWRQPVGAAASGRPAVDDGQVYLPTVDGALHQIDLETGRLTARLRFSQQLVAAPTVVAGGSRLVAMGDSQLIYTLSMRPLQCERVDFLGHRRGSIRAPLLEMGGLLLVAENDRPGAARLRALDLSAPDKWMQERGTARVEGHVADRPVIRGKELFVPSSEERVSSFVVSDLPGQVSLTAGPRYQTPQPRSTPASLAVGPDGQLWLASSGLRRLQLKADSLKLDGPVLAEGISTQPMQILGKTLFLGRRQADSDAVLFTQADRDKMESPWRTVLGSASIASLPHQDGLTTVTDRGDVFRITTRDIATGGFRLDPQSQLKLPEKRDAPLRGAAFDQDRVSVFTEGSPAILALVNVGGQVEREWKLETPLESAPIPLSNGIVLPLSGRLRFLPLAGNGAVEDYRLPVGEKAPPRWRRLIPLDETQFLAVTATGLVIKVQLRTAPVPHLASVVDLDLQRPVDVEPAAFNGRFVVADAQNRVQIFDTATFEPRGTLTAPSRITGAIAIVGERAFIEIDRKELAALPLDGEFKIAWRVPLKSSMAGPPLWRDGQWFLADVSGEVTIVTAETGMVESKTTLDQPLVGGIIAVGQHLVVSTVDGSLLRIEPAVKP